MFLFKLLIKHIKFTNFYTISFLKKNHPHHVLMRIFTKNALQNPQKVVITMLPSIYSAFFSLCFSALKSTNRQENIQSSQGTNSIYWKIVENFKVKIFFSENSICYELCCLECIFLLKKDKLIHVLKINIFIKYLLFVLNISIYVFRQFALIKQIRLENLRIYNILRK